MQSLRSVLPWLGNTGDRSAYPCNFHDVLCGFARIETIILHLLSSQQAKSPDRISGVIFHLVRCSNSQKPLFVMVSDGKGRLMTEIFTPGKGGAGRRRIGAQGKNEDDGHKCRRRGEADPKRLSHDG